MEPLVLIFLGGLIFSTHFFNGIFKYTRIPTALILLTLGILIGPVFKLVSIADFGKTAAYFSVITLIFLLFESGTSLRIEDLKKGIGRASGVTVLNFFISASIATGVAMLASKFYYNDALDIISASFFGAIVAGTSSAVVIPIVKQMKMDKDSETLLVLESALSDVLCLVIGLALFGAMRNGEFSMVALLHSLWQSFLIALVLGVLGGWFWSLLLNKVRNLENPGFTSFAFAFLIYGICEQLKLNGGIAVLAFGVTLGNASSLNQTFVGNLMRSETLRSTEKSFFSELVFLFGTLFFVLVGISIEFGQPMVYLFALIIVLGIIFLRPVSIRIFANQKHLSFKDRAVMAVMAPKGLVPAILATLPIIEGNKIGSKLLIEKGIIIKDLTFAVVLLSIFICAVLVILLSNRPDNLGFINWMLGRDRRSEEDTPSEQFENASLDAASEEGDSEGLQDDSI